MKTLAFLLAFTCTYVGNYYYCYDDGGGSVTCTKVGGYTYCY